MDPFARAARARVIFLAPRFTYYYSLHTGRSVSFMAQRTKNLHLELKAQLVFVYLFVTEPKLGPQLF